VEGLEPVVQVKPNWKWTEEACGNELGH
jgi:hypothetical protein